MEIIPEEILINSFPCNQDVMLYDSGNVFINSIGLLNFEKTFR